MIDPSLDPVERQLGNLPWPTTPPDLRGAVLSGVRRQLAAQRWDRRLARAAVIVLGTGMALNGLVVLRDPQRPGSRVAVAARSDTIVQAAVVVAEATDLETGNQFARHLAALSGTTLTPRQAAAIQQQVKPRPSAGPRKEG